MDVSEKVERYFAEEHEFKKGIEILRDLALKTKVQETYKWMFPVYTIDNKNVFWISKFKNHFGIGFFNGVFLNDLNGVLENVQEGKTQAMRHWKFTSSDEIDEKGVLAYMNEAIENEEKGLKLIPIKKESITTNIPTLLKNALKKDASAKKAFSTLTPYKQKEYANYIANAKQEKTKLSRLEKILPMIRNGVGINDMYRS